MTMMMMPVVPSEENWVNVTWMPHASLSQTSHVCVLVRSSHVILEDHHPHQRQQEEEWKIRAMVYGMGGLPLIPVASTTPASPLVPRRRRRTTGRNQNTDAAAANTSSSINSGSSTTTATTATLHQDRKPQTHPPNQQQEQPSSATAKSALMTTATTEDDVPSVLLPSVAHATHDCQWDTLLQIPMRWRDLPRDAYLWLELVDHTDSVVRSAKMKFFNTYGRLSTGLMRLSLPQPGNDKKSEHEHQHQRESISSSPRHDDEEEEEEDPVWKASLMLDQLESFEEARSGGGAGGGGISPMTSTNTNDTRKIFGRVQSVPWLDAISKEYCRNVIQDTATTTTSSSLSYYHDHDHCPWYLIVELPVFDVPVMHEESFYPIPQQAASGAVSPLELSVYRNNNKNTATAKTITTTTTNNEDRSTSLASFHPLQLVDYVDYENELDNPVEEKYRTLAHDLLRGLVDPALKPDREQRDRLAAIIASPSHHPTREEKDLLWRFRFSLVDNQRALTKFLLAVDWTVESEVVQAAELLDQWRRLEIPDALKLLGKHVAFQTNLVRTYAIDTLATAPDVELRLYLLQLVQALKYEAMPGGPETTTRSPTTTPRMSNSNNYSDSGGSSSSLNISSLASFLIGRAAGNLQLANYLYWYLKVELQDPTHGARYQEVFQALKARLSETSFRMGGSYSLSSSTGATLDGSEPSHNNNGTPAAAITTATGGGESTKETKAKSFKSIVSSVSNKLGSSLRGSDTSAGRPSDRSKKQSRQRTFWDILVEQDEFITGLMEIQMRCRDTRGKKDAKETLLQTLLSSEGYDRNPTRDPVPLPSAPHVMVNGVNPKTAKMFKSALYPALIDFHVETTLPMIGEADLGGHTSSAPSLHQQQQHQSSATKVLSISNLDHLSHFKVIVKTGDDLRQDQLVIMLVQLMDGLLKRAALNLCLTPYSILAMSPTSGLVEFVDGSMPISQILSTYNGSIMHYFQEVAPQKGAKYDVRPDVISTYVRSCAGYCVITFLLAVGDRHLDNILLDSSGHFFHIDFGFIFGRDPKPLPPLFRLTREMVEGMGGMESSEYRQFCSLACQAFNALRKSAGLILNLLHLMSDAGIEDLSNNPSADAEGVIAKVEERFRLELTDEQAERYFLGLINDCLSAIAPRVMDVFHSLAVARR